MVTSSFSCGGLSSVQDVAYMTSVGGGDVDLDMTYTSLTGVMYSPTSMSLSTTATIQSVEALIVSYSIFSLVLYLVILNWILMHHYIDVENRMSSVKHCITEDVTVDFPSD